MDIGTDDSWLLQRRVRRHSSLIFFSSRRRHSRCELVTGGQTCALPISCVQPAARVRSEPGSNSQVTWAADRHRSIEPATGNAEIARASCRERVCQYV